MPSPFDDIFGGTGPQWTTDQIKARIRSEAQQQGVDPDLALAVATQESYLNPNARGDNGKSIGLFQLQEAAAKDAGINPQWRDDPGVNIYGGIRYLKQKIDQSKGNVDEALSRYNRGTPAYRGIGDPNYVQNVKRFLPGSGPQAQVQPQVQPQAQAQAQAQRPGMMARVASVFSPASAEASTPQQEATGTVWDDIFGGQQATPQPAAAPQPPTARSTPEQDAAYRQWAAQQGAGGPQPPAPASQTTPQPVAPPAASQGPGAPRLSMGDPTEAASETEAAATIAQMRQRQTPALERFLALPSIAQLTPPEREQVQREFQALPPDQQEQVIQQEVPQDLQQAMEKPQASYPRRQGEAPRPGEKTLGVPDQAPVTESLTAPSTMIPLLMPGAGAKAVVPLIAKAPAAVGRLIRPLAEGVSQTLGFGTGRTVETGEIPSAGELGTTLGVTTALGGVLEQAAPLVAKVGNAITATVKPAYQSIVDTAKKYGIRLTYGDITRGSIAPKVETGLEALPLTGGGTMRASGQKDVARAGERIRTGLQSEMQQTPWRDLASVKQAASGTGPRAKEAQILLAEISEAGDDWGRVIQTSGKLNLFQDRVRAEKLYDQVETLAQPLGNMRLPKATQAIDDAIARASDDVLPSPEVKREVIGALNRIKGEISPTASVKPSMGVRDPVTGTLRAEPVTPTTSIPDTTYSRMRRLRSSLGDLQREAAEPATARYLSGVKTALEEDMAAFTQQAGVPQLTKAAKDADTFFRTRIVPYREGQLAKVIEKNLPDEIYNQFVRRGKDRAEYFYKGLDAKGQAAVRYGMVEEAVNKAYSGAPDVFSPARFATSLKKIQEAHGVFFKGTPQWEINGITKLMEHGKRFGEYMENPPTGLRGAFLGAMVGTGGLAAVPYAVKALTIGQGLRMMLMTQRGRNFLLAASDMQPGSSAFQKRLDTFLRTSPEASRLVSAARSQTQEEPAATP